VNSPSERDVNEHALVLFVCSGNTCRSPLAEVIFARLAADRGRTDLEAASAGIIAATGDPVSRGARQVAHSHGLDLTHKRSQRLTADLIQRADLILVMEPKHRTDVLNYVPSADERVYVLTSLVPSRGLNGVPDPFGGSIDDYRRCFDVLNGVMAEAFPQIESRLKRLSERRGPRRG
jgi:protein-tyrosine-phosphatase